MKRKPNKPKQEPRERPGSWESAANPGGAAGGGSPGGAGAADSGTSGQSGQKSGGFGELPTKHFCGAPGHAK